MAVLNKAQITSKITTTTGEQTEVTTYSNTHRANEVDSDIIILKTPEKDWVIPKDVIKITTTITNNTDVDIDTLKIKDTLGEGASFVEGSVEISGQKYENYSITNGFTMPVTLGGSGNDVDVSYNIKVDDYLNVDKITNTSLLTVTLDNTDFSLTSNELEVTVLNNEVYLLKEADKKAVKSGDTITYTITITNEGTLKNTEVKFMDTIPDTVTFVEKSVKIDDVSYENYNPTEGFSLKDLDANDSTKVEFQVNVN